MANTIQAALEAEENQRVAAIKKLAAELTGADAPPADLVAALLVRGYSAAIAAVALQQWREQQFVRLPNGSTWGEEPPA